MKKTNFLFTIATVMLAMSCSNHDVESPAKGEGTVTIRFNVSNYEQIDMDAASTRSTNITNLGYLELGVYDAETIELTQDILQAMDDDDYGNFSVTLTYGTYQLVFLGWTGSHDSDPDIEDPTAIQFEDQYVPHLFCKTMELTVDDNTAGTQQSVALSRVVGDFRVVISDAIPDDMDRVDVKVEGSSYILNSLTGYVDKLLERNYSITDWDGVAGNTDEAFNVYTYLPSDEETTMTFTCTAYSTSGGVLASHTFTDVPMKINRLTRYTGNFFTKETAEGGFSVSLADDYSWIDIDDYDFHFSDY